MRGEGKDGWLFWIRKTSVVIDEIVRIIEAMAVWQRDTYCGEDSLDGSIHRKCVRVEVMKGVVGLEGCKGL